MDTKEKMRMIVMNGYDIRHLDSRCNYPHCRSAPEKSIEIFEFTLQKNIGIARLFLCKEHVNSASGLMKTLRKTFPDIIIQHKESELQGKGN